MLTDVTFSGQIYKIKEQWFMFKILLITDQILSVDYLYFSILTTWKCASSSLHRQIIQILICPVATFHLIISH